ncbi:unnamed protein product [Phytophthora fragariaefolia]|uniref:Unnamed protein product n=1 Tax=Phytophthora fragariaefolia TaxID=1490495 RepID=A0A9W6YMU4_9STRA|nr:unnamed protein product [Phytophthora fragariaefolia]
MISRAPSSGSSRAPDGGRLRMESFDQHPDHPVSKTVIASSSVNAAMISDILPRAAGLTSSVTPVAATGTLFGYAESDPARSVRSFMKTNMENGKKFQAVKTLARQERVGLKTTPELCVLVYVGPELRSKSQDNHQCMTGMSENEEYLSDLPRPDQPRLEDDCPDNNDWDDPPEFRLGPRQRYGWWEEHNSDETKKVAMSEPPCVRTPEYQWPKKLLVRSSAGSAQVHMEQLQPRPNVDAEKSVAKTDVQLSETEISGTSDSEGTESWEAKLIEENGGSHEDSGSSGEVLADWDPVMIIDEDSDSDDETFYDAISFDGADEDVYSQEVVKTESQTGTCSDRLLRPARRLEMEYEWCMQMSAEELGLEPAVYIHEGSELLAQLRDELAKLPELRELSPECDIDKADVGEPGRTTPAEEEKLRMRLSGFRAIRMTKRVKLISAFVCPFGHFQWVRMPFGLKNAPLVYQTVINNCLWGFDRLSPEEEAEVDQDVLEFLGLDPSRREESGSQVSALTDTVTVSQRNIPAPASMGPALERSSYIDDPAHGAPTWDQLCDDLGAHLFRLRYWNISVSLPKSEFGKLSIPYLLHEISAEGIRAVPKIVKEVQDLPFPKTLKGVQSFLGNLNYYHKFIEDFPVVAAVLYELSDDQVRSERDLTRAKVAFEILKKKIVSMPLLRHPDRSKSFVIIPHANRWAACAVLGQEYDGKIQPVRLTGRVLNDAELRYHIAEKEVITVLRVLQSFRTLLEGCRLEGYTRHSVFKWILQSNTADGRCVPWGVMLSHWDITVGKVQRDEDGLAAIMGAGITPREHLDGVAELFIPAKGRVRKPPVLSVEMFDDTYQGIVRFDGAAKTSTRRGSCGRILWQLPGGKVLEARGFTLDDVSVNDAEHNGLLKGVKRALHRSKTKDRIRPSPEGVEDASPDDEEPRRPMTPLEYQAERWRRIRVHQEQDIYLSEIKYFLKGDIGRFSPRRLRKISKVADLFALDARDVLYRLDRSTRGRPRDFVDEPRLVIPNVLRSDKLHYAHEDFQGGHQGITRTHDQDPRFMSDVFTRFKELLGSKQRATLAYCPQTNGQQERSVQTVVRSIRAYIAKADQSDWDDHAERLLFALNTSFDATRLDTTFYMVHGWGAQGTLSAMLGPKPSSIPERTAFEWRRKVQRQYSYAIACAEDLQKKAKRQRSEIQIQKRKELSERLMSGFDKGDVEWLYIPKVQPGLSRKLAHMWHGPFRIEEMHGDIRVKLKVTDSGYRVNPWVHASRLKPRALFPKRPTGEIEVAEDDDFDAALLPEDSWEPNSERNEYEVETILDLRWCKRFWTSDGAKELGLPDVIGNICLKWKGYDDPE